MDPRQDTPLTSQASGADPSESSSENGAAYRRFYDALTSTRDTNDEFRVDELEGNEDDEDDDVFDPEDDIVFHDADGNEVAVELVFGSGDDEDDQDEDEDFEDDDEEDGENDANEEEDEDDDDDDDNEEYVAPTGTQTRMITREQLWRLVQNQRHLVQFITTGEGLDDEDEFDDFEPIPGRRVLRRRRAPEPIKPSKTGIELQRTGRFGSNETDRRIKKTIARRLLDREHGVGAYEERKRNSGLLTQNLLPSVRADQILHYDEPVYSGQFSDDGNFYFSVCQDFRVRMYDTSNPYDWKIYKTVAYPWGHWTLTDASLSPDNKWLAYTSHSPLVSIAPTDPLDKGDPYTLDLEGTEDGPATHRMNFSIFSVRFSGDGRELVAGTRHRSLVVYDIESRRVLHTIAGHDDDVNAVCFADKDSPHIIYSGSDDATVKVWDRRNLAGGRESGVFVGHMDGLTYIDSKGDGRYVLSNGKDQTAKLWDLRKAVSSTTFNREDMSRHTRSHQYDYRYVDEFEHTYPAHPNDNSLVTFRGHAVKRTLIRCHFSPPGSSDSRYVYTGSSDGRVHIYNMDGTVAKTIDVSKATRATRKKDGHTRFWHYDEPNSWSALVRDVSWHPHAPMIAASAWNGYNMARGTTSVHSFTGSKFDDGEPPMGRSYDAKLRQQRNLFDANYSDADF